MEEEGERTSRKNWFGGKGHGVWKNFNDIGKGRAECAKQRESKKRAKGVSQRKKPAKWGIRGELGKCHATCKKKGGESAGAPREKRGYKLSWGKKTTVKHLQWKSCKG